MNPCISFLSNSYKSLENQERNSVTAHEKMYLGFIIFRLARTQEKFIDTKSEHKTQILQEVRKEDISRL